MQTIRQIVGDRARAWSAVLVDDQGNPINVNGETITLRLLEAMTGTVKIAGSPAVVDDDGGEALRGQVHYEPAAADVDTAGVYLGYFLRDLSGKVEHIPGQAADLEVVILEEVPTY
jgi:hypothetical protein